MSEFLLKCEGMQTEQVLVPAFEVCERDFVNLRIPTDMGVHTGEVIRNILEPAPNGPIQCCVDITFVDFAMPRTGLREFFRWERATEWLARQTQCSLEDAAETLSQYDIPLQQAVCTFAGNPRKLLSLAAIYGTGCRLLVFECVGMDPMGVRRFVQAVGARLDQSAALQITSDTYTETCTELGLDAYYTKVIDCQFTGDAPVTRRSIIEMIEGPRVKV